MGKITSYLTTTIHNKLQTACITLGMYCACYIHIYMHIWWLKIHLLMLKYKIYTWSNKLVSYKSRRTWYYKHTRIMTSHIYPDTCPILELHKGTSVNCRNVFVLAWNHHQVELYVILANHRGCTSCYMPIIPLGKPLHVQAVARVCTEKFTNFRGSEVSRGKHVQIQSYPDSKVQGANMGPTWVLLVPMLAPWTLLWG